MGQTDMLEDLVGMIGQDDKDMLEIDTALQFEDFDVNLNKYGRSVKAENGPRLTSQRPGSSTKATEHDKMINEKTVMIQHSSDNINLLELTTMPLNGKLLDEGPSTVARDMKDQRRTVQHKSNKIMMLEAE